MVLVHTQYTRDDEELYFAMMKDYDEQELYFDELPVYSYSNKLPSRLFYINYDKIDKFVETFNMMVKFKTCNKSVTCLAWYAPSFKR